MPGDDLHKRYEPDPQERQERRDRELEKAPAQFADCFLHGRYDVDENGVGRCPVCKLGTGPE